MNSLSKKQTSFFIVYLLVFALASVEMFFAKFAQYTENSNRMSAFFPVLAFCSLAMGNLLYLRIRKLRENFGLCLLLTVFTIPFALLVSNAVREHPGLIMALMIVPFGALICHIFEKMDLRGIILASAAGGVSYFIFYILFYAFWGEWFPSLTSLALALALPFVLDSHFKKSFALSAGLLVAIFCANLAGILSPKSLFERGFIRGGKEIVMPAIHGLLMTTDLFEGNRTVEGKKKGRYYLVTNGARIAIIDEKPRSLGRYSVPYMLKGDIKSVLVIGASEGLNVETGLQFGVDRIVAVDINPQVFSLLKEGFLSEVLDHIYRDPKVETVAQEARHYVEHTSQTFDLITLQGVQTGMNATAGGQALIESFLFTREALRAYFNKLNENGSIWLDEFMFHTSTRASLGEVLVETFRAEFPDLNPAEHIFHLRYSSRGVRVDRRVVPEWMEKREMLVISKSPLRSEIGAVSHTIAKLEKLKLNPELMSISAKPRPEIALTDDHPFLFNRSLPLNQSGATILALLTALVGSFAAFHLGPKGAKPSSLSMFVLGMAYIFAVAGLASPISLLTGHPEFSTVLLFATLYFSAAIGGLIGLRLDLKKTLFLVTLLCLFLVVVPSFFEAAKPSLLAKSEVVVPLIFVTSIIFIHGLLSDIPYAYVLKNVDGATRPALVTSENFGNIAGGLCVILLHISFGYSAVLYVSSAAFFLCGLAMWAQNGFSLK